MTESHESSLLFSLAELRSIEEQRLAEEAHALRRASEAEREHRRAADARAEAAEAERVALAHRAERAEAERREAAQRREWLAVEEAERLARVSADERLAHERLAGEILARKVEAARQRPLSLVFLNVIVVAGFAILGIAHMKLRGELQDSRSQLEAARGDAREASVRADDLSNSRLAVLVKLQELERERDDLGARLAAVGGEREAREPRATRPRAARDRASPQTRTRPSEAVTPPCSPAEPLCGLPPEQR